MPSQLNAVRSAFERIVPLTDALWGDLQRRLYARTFAKRDMLVSEGQVCQQIAFVTKGSFRYYKVLDGLEVTTYFSFENDWVSDYTSFIRQAPSATTIEAMEGAEAYLLSYADMQELYEHHPLFERFGRLIAEYLLTCFEDRMASLLLKTPEERYEKTLRDNRHYFERVPQHYIASYLGIRPESLSRLRNRMMRKAGD